MENKRFYCEINLRAVPKQSVCVGVTKRGKRVFYPPPKGAAWQRTLIYEFLAAKGREFKILECDTSVVLNFFFTNKRHGNTDNLTKPVLDALAQAGVIKNDERVLHLEVAICELAEKPWMTVEVSEWRGITCESSKFPEITIVTHFEAPTTIRGNTPSKPWSPAQYNRELQKGKTRASSGLSERYASGKVHCGGSSTTADAGEIVLTIRGVKTTKGKARGKGWGRFIFGKGAK